MMKKHTFRYYVYTQEGKCIFDSSHRADALVWCGGNGNYVVRKDLLGNYPDKKITKTF